ncbi:hypothetical protein ACFXPE_09825, partial [Streptomyces scopuliridis]
LLPLAGRRRGAPVPAAVTARPRPGGGGRPPPPAGGGGADGEAERLSISDAFASSLETSQLVGAVAVLAGGLLAALLLRRAERANPTPGSPGSSKGSQGSQGSPPGPPSASSSGSASDFVSGAA